MSVEEVSPEEVAQEVEAEGTERAKPEEASEKDEEPEQPEEEAEEEEEDEEESPKEGEAEAVEDEEKKCEEKRDEDEEKKREEEVEDEEKKCADDLLDMDGDDGCCIMQSAEHDGACPLEKRARSSADFEPAQPEAALAEPTGRGCGGRGPGGGGRGSGGGRGRGGRGRGSKRTAPDDPEACEPKACGVKTCSNVVEGKQGYCLDAGHKDAYDALSYQFSKRGGATPPQIDAWQKTKDNKEELSRAILQHTYENRERKKNGHWAKFDIIQFREIHAAKQSVAAKWKARHMDYGEFMEAKEGVPPDEAHAEWVALEKSTPDPLKEWTGKLDAQGRPTVKLPVVVERWLEGAEEVSRTRQMEQASNPLKAAKVTDEELEGLEAGVTKGHRGFGDSAFGLLGGSVGAAQGISSLLHGEIGIGQAPDVGSASASSTTTPKKKKVGEGLPGNDKSPADKDNNANKLAFQRMACEEKAGKDLRELQSNMDKAINAASDYIGLLGEDEQSYVRKYVAILQGRVDTVNCLRHKDQEEYSEHLTKVDNTILFNIDLLVPMNKMRLQVPKFKDETTSDGLAKREQQFTMDAVRMREAVSSLGVGIGEVKKALLSHHREVAKAEKKEKREAEKLARRMSQAPPSVALKNPGPGGPGRKRGGGAMARAKTGTPIFGVGGDFLPPTRFASMEEFLAARSEGRVDDDKPYVIEDASLEEFTTKEADAKLNTTIDIFCQTFMATQKAKAAGRCNAPFTVAKPLIIKHIGNCCPEDKKWMAVETGPEAHAYMRQLDLVGMYGIVAAATTPPYYGTEVSPRNTTGYLVDSQIGYSHSQSQFVITECIENQTVVCLSVCLCLCLCLSVGLPVEGSGKLLKLATGPGL